MSIDDRLRRSAEEARAKTAGIDVASARAALAARQRRAVVALGAAAAVVLVAASLSAVVWSRAEPDDGDRVVAAGLDDERLQRSVANRFRSAEDASVVVAANGSVLGSVPQRGTSVLAAIGRETYRSVVGDVDVKRGLRIETTIDPGLQDRLEDVVAATMENLPADLVATVIVVDPASGSVLGLVDPAGLARTPRVHGSAVLPVIAAVALDAGVPTDLPLPAPARLTAADGTDVVDPSGLDRGTLTIAAAVDAASPTAFASLAQLVDPVTLVGRIQRAGIASPLTGDTGLLIGRDPMALWDLTAAFRALGAAGQLRDVGVIDRVVAESGSVLFDSSPTDRAVFQPTSAALVRSAMGSSTVGSSRTDQTAIGSTPELLIGVHVGYADGRELPAPLGQAGNVAATVLARLLQR